jgi:salicylate hydroxylase
VAQKHGAVLLTDSRVIQIDYSTPKVRVLTSAGHEHTFELLIGSDGVKSIVRQTLFPTITPKPPTANCAYRAIVPYSIVEKDPLARSLLTAPTMEVWMGTGSYIITYPISNCQDLNLVLSHHLDRLVSSVEDVSVDEMREQYKGYDERIKRVVGMIDSVQRWPLLVTGPLESWSSPSKNVVVMGDAAHSMTNHMAQGAATAMEDGAFLARCISQVVQSKLTLEQAVTIYEKGRMPKAKRKQEISFLNGAIWQLPEGKGGEARDRAMKWELGGKEERGWRSPNLYGDPRVVWEVYGYDAEEHADECLRDGVGMEANIGVAEKYLGWFLHGEEGKEVVEQVKSKL